MPRRSARARRGSSPIRKPEPRHALSGRRTGARSGPRRTGGAEGVRATARRTGDRGRSARADHAGCQARLRHRLRQVAHRRIRRRPLLRAARRHRSWRTGPSPRADRRRDQGAGCVRTRLPPRGQERCCTDAFVTHARQARQARRQAAGRHPARGRALRAVPDPARRDGAGILPRRDGRRHPPAGACGQATGRLSRVSHRIATAWGFT